MKLLVINGSVRENRVTPRVGKWVERHTRTLLEDIKTEVVDLGDLSLPMFDEAISPLMNPDRDPTGKVKEWLEMLKAADGYIFITPEYNHSVPSGLKNAIDYIDRQIMKKPFMVVGHGGVGGARATEQLKLMLNANIGAVPIPLTVPIIGFIGYEDLISTKGEANTEPVRKLEGTLKQGLELLKWYMEALKNAQEKDNDNRSRLETEVKRRAVPSTA